MFSNGSLATVVSDANTFLDTIYYLNVISVTSVTSGRAPNDRYTITVVYFVG